MKAVLQRVKNAEVTVDGESVGKIGEGYMLLLGVMNGDTKEDAELLAKKTAMLRVFTDENDKMNLSLEDVGGSMLVISQFTLYGDCRKGKRPSFDKAAGAEMANAYYEKFVAGARAKGLSVGTGKFQAHMLVSLVNNGPVTILLDSKKNF